jgi:hypothetical protein
MSCRTIMTDLRTWRKGVNKMANKGVKGSPSSFAKGILKRAAEYEKQQKKRIGK